MLWPRDLSASPQEWTRFCQNCPTWTTLHVCGIYEVASSPILLTFFFLKNLSLISVVQNLCLLGEIKFLRSPFTQKGAFFLLRFWHFSFSIFKLISIFFFFWGGDLKLLLYCLLFRLCRTASVFTITQPTGWKFGVLADPSLEGMSTLQCWD